MKALFTVGRGCACRFTDMKMIGDVGWWTYLQGKQISKPMLSICLSVKLLQDHKIYCDCSLYADIKYTVEETHKNGCLIHNVTTMCYGIQAK